MNPGATKTERHTIQEQCQRALAAVQRCIEQYPDLNFSLTSQAEREIVRLRDPLIAARRIAPEAAQTNWVQPALDQANVALSLITILTYPASGLRQEPLTEARSALERCLQHLSD